MDPGTGDAQPMHNPCTWHTYAIRAQMTCRGRAFVRAGGDAYGQGAAPARRTRRTAPALPGDEIGDIAMLTQIEGLHHVTSIASDAAATDAFHRRALGLRRVKKTVNFDAPEVYHLYYGDGAGTPGSVATYFPFPGARPAPRGTGEVGTVTYAVPEGAARMVGRSAGRRGRGDGVRGAAAGLRRSGRRAAGPGRARRRRARPLGRRGAGRPCDPRLRRRAHARGGRGGDGRAAAVHGL